MTIWTEIKPILGPLIQAAVVLIVGIFTLIFQRRQARVAERKLFTDLHDKRYRALTSFTHDITELVLEVIKSNDSTTPPMDAEDRQRQSRQMFARMQELEWLFGSDVMSQVNRMHDRAETILNLANQLRHQFKTDDKVAVVEAINEHNNDLYDALGHISFAARHYLYVGNIKINAPDKEDATVVHVPQLPSAKRIWPESPTTSKADD